MNTNQICNTDDQITQRVDSMDFNDLPSYTAKKVKATLSKKISTTTPIELLSTQTASIQNDEKLEPPKILQGTSIPKQVTVLYKDPQSTDLSDIKFSYDNLYIVKTHMPDPNEKPQELLQQPDPAQVNKHTNEQNKDIAMDGKDDMTPITSNTRQYMMDTDAASIQQ
ncbi:21847_t:CDS:2 [Gigaspora margarita]|uniref:21847_t:CDS:1 n=1 Tax=Gigaspora margarita TaxID=4874 RepID=A0ABN7UUH0_GIGMA|nr:21847_t:CDS:2 [Gigaspora margarita]